nr:tyrosine-type recombinase/integrase [Mycolicibacterium frederiksbergense]
MASDPIPDWFGSFLIDRQTRKPSAVPGALVHGLRHTYATELASSDVSVYTLMNLLGHESMTASQRHLTAASTETCHSASRNPLYAWISAQDKR